MKLESTLTVCRADSSTGRKNLARWVKGDAPGGITRAKLSSKIRSCERLLCPGSRVGYVGNFWPYPIVHWPPLHPPGTAPQFPGFLSPKSPHHCRQNFLEVSQEHPCPVSDFPPHTLFCQSWFVLSGVYEGTGHTQFPSGTGSWSQF